MFSRKKIQGVTLVELIVVVALIGLVAGGATELMRLGFASYKTGHEIIDADWQGRVALERMVRDLHTVPADDAITSANAGSITFYELDGTLVTYQISNGKLMRNSQILADNAQNLFFKYYDADGNELTALPVNTYAVRYLTIDLEINNGDTFNFSTGVGLWNLD